jgi:chromosome segregation ATPase
MKKRKLPKSITKIQDLSHDAVPASVDLVKEVRDELKADIRSLDHKISSLDHKINSLDHKISSLDHKIDSVEDGLVSKIELVNSKVDLVLVSVHRTQMLMEEQRGENRIVLDGIKNLIQKQDRLETDVGELQIELKALSRSA